MCEPLQLFSVSMSWKEIPLEDSPEEPESVRGIQPWQILPLDAEPALGNVALMPPRAGARRKWQDLDEGPP